MAKKTATPKQITVAHLVEKYGLDPKKIRAEIRKLGYNAPPIEEEQPNNFGPKAKYIFLEGSKELKAVEKRLAELTEG